MAAQEMNEGVATLFESFALRSEYEDAMEFINVCTNLIPTPFVVNDMIFKIMKNCDAKLVNEGSAYLLNLLSLLPKDPNQNYDFERALKHPTGALPDVWSVLSYFVLSSLHHYDIPEVTSVLSDSDVVKSPNCDILADFYVKVLTTCCDVKRAHSILLKNHPEERLAQLLFWINQYYKFNIEQAMILQSLHNLLDYIVKCEVFDDASLPVHMIVNKSSLSEIALLVLNTCKDAFDNPESEARFFNNTTLPYLIVKVCHHKLNSMIQEFITEEPDEVTLSTIVVDYIPFQVRRTQDVDMSSLSSQRKSNRLRKFTKEAVP
ncbi:ANK_REP_REGION domain-containing protein, partial [Nephila pilipes]